MSRRFQAFLAATPLIVAGSLTAHELSYWLVAPDPSARATLLAASGHSYLEYAPLGFAILSVLSLLGLADRVLGAVRREPRARISPWMFFLLPPIAFALQEHAERLLHSGHLPLAAALEPTFLIGLALQLPFALAALAIARLLLSLADRLGMALGRTRTPHSPLARQIVPAGAESEFPRQTVLALGYPGRGPPLPTR